jgi:hypothetical protein
VFKDEIKLDMCCLVRNGSCCEAIWQSIKQMTQINSNNKKLKDFKDDNHSLQVSELPLLRVPFLHIFAFGTNLTINNQSTTQQQQQSTNEIE